MVTIMKYKKRKIYHTIYIKVFSDRTVSYLTFSPDDVTKTTNNETEFTELRRFFEENYQIRVQEISVLKCKNFRICQSPLGFSIYHTYKIM